MSDGEFAVIMLDVEGHIRGWSASAERLTGWACRDVYDLSHGVFYAPDKRATGFPATALRIAQSEVFQDRTVCVRKDGSTFGAEITVTAVYDAEDTLCGFTNLIRDVASSDAEKAQSERVAVLGQLAGGVAHDFNNILQVITGNASMIQATPNDTVVMQRCISRMVKAADRGAAISGRLLAFARRGNGVASKGTDVKLLFDSIQELLGPLLPANINVTTKVETNLPLILADLAQLETVLVNLATNARDAMDSGGNLVFSANLIQTATNNLGLNIGPYVRITVADNGCGMDAGTIAQVMEPFFTTKAKGKGTGLGLHLAKTFAHHSNGALEIASEQNVSTEVRLWLPVAAAIEDTRHHHEIEPVEVSIAARILVVEDDDLVRETMASSLEHGGFIALEVSDGETALETLGNSHIDAVVVDYALPGMDGIATIREVQRRQDATPALLVTGNIGEMLVEGMKPNFSLLRKPFSPMQLITAVKSLLTKVKSTKP